MKRCIQADLDDAGAFRRINENNSERPVCIVHAPAQLVFFLGKHASGAMRASGGNACVRALCQHPQKRLERISVVTEDVEEILDSQLKTAAGLARC